MTLPETVKSNASGEEGRFALWLITQKRYAREFVFDVVRMRKLLPLLMKMRNGGNWTAEEKSELLMQMRILSRVSPTLLLLLLPGSALLLPIYAW